MDYLENLCKNGISLLCIMAANNEIGTIYPIQNIGQIAQTYRIPFLCDASQAVGKIPINFQDWGITYLAISTGSACTSGVETPSHVLRAIRLSDNLIEGALRIGLGKFTTDTEISQAAAILSTAVSKIRQGKIYPCSPWFQTCHGTSLHCSPTRLIQQTRIRLLTG